MRNRFPLRPVWVAATIIALSAGGALAKTVQVTITNTQSSGGLSLTPLFFGFHDGSFDTFDPGALASAALEDLAEEGDVGPVLGVANAAGVTTGVAAAPGGFADAPVIEPGETASFIVDLLPGQRYFSYLSMVIPSNDLFIGNPDPLAYEIFDASGMFTRIADIVLTTANVWDAGTEENNNLGAAFNTNNPTAATDASNPIALAGDLGFLIGEGTPVGPVTGIGTSLATISVAVVPLPASMSLSLLALGALGIARRARKRA